MCLYNPSSENIPVPGFASVNLPIDSTLVIVLNVRAIVRRAVAITETELLKSLATYKIPLAESKAIPNGP